MLLSKLCVLIACCVVLCRPAVNSKILDSSECSSESKLRQLHHRVTTKTSRMEAAFNGRIKLGWPAAVRLLGAAGHAVCSCSICSAAEHERVLQPWLQ
jgi:hypothetical protein